MRVHILPWDGQIEGLGPGDGAAMPLWGEPVGGAVARRAGRDAAPWDGGATLVVREGTALGRHALRAAWAAGQAGGRDVAFHLGGRVGALAAEVRQGRRGGLWYLTASPGEDPGAASLAARLTAAADRELDPAEQSLQVWLPGADPFAVSDRLFLPIDHWVHLLWANLMGLGPALWGALAGRSLGVALLRLAWACVRSLSLRPEVVAARLSRRGRGARVHPRAVVEGSWLGPRVRVGAGAVVRGCFLGEGVVVEDLAVCEGVVAGPRAVVQRQALCKFSVVGAGAAVAGAVQLGVLGAGASLKRGSYLMDQTLDASRPVMVRVGEALAPAPMGMTGVCLGPGTTVGSGVWVAPGRCVPPGLLIGLADPLVHPAPAGADRDDVGGAFVVRDGRLVRP